MHPRGSDEAHPNGPLAHPQPDLRPSPRSDAADLAELMRQAFAGLMPMTSDLTALFDRMETAR